MSNFFISCDWGTSTLRLRLVDKTMLKVISVIENQNGILSVHHSWLQQKKSETERQTFYLQFLNQSIQKLEKQSDQSLTGIPVVISGMAVSSLGVKEVQYSEVPVFGSGSNLKTDLIESSDKFPHNILLISGIKTKNEVMRGEETQLIGALDGKTSDGLYILPGSHSKLVTVEKGMIVDLKTYMTGEFFSLLLNSSSLTYSLEKPEHFENENNLKCFKEGVNAGIHSNLLNSAFQVRVNDLFKTKSKVENYFFLSGLTIGSEIKDLPRNKIMTVVGNEMLNNGYSIALKEIDADVILMDASEAIIKGQYILMNSNIAC